MIHNIAAELTSIADELGDAIRDAQKFDKGNDAAGTRVRKAANEARSRLLGLRLMVSEVRHERENEKATA